MTTRRRLVAGCGVAFLALAALGCEEKGPAQRAGEKIDDAAKKVGEAIEEAGRKVQDAAKD
jgi:hyperosmotically inducible protein